MLSKSIQERHVEALLVNLHRRRYPAKSTIIYEGDSSESVYYLLQGSITVVIEDDDGREMILAYLNSGDFFGEMGLFNQEQSRSAWVKAKTDCEVIEITYAKFRELTTAHPELLFAIEKQMASRLRTTTRKVINLAFLDVTGRVASTLLDLCREPGAVAHPEGMQIKVTRNEIAQIVGCSREMVGRVLKTMEERNLISAHGKTIVVYGTRSFEKLGVS